MKNTTSRSYRFIVTTFLLVLALATPALANTSVTGKGGSGQGGGGVAGGSPGSVACSPGHIGDPKYCALPVGSVPCSTSAIQNMVARYGYAPNFSLCTYNPGHGIFIVPPQKTSASSQLGTDLSVCATGFDVWRFYGTTTGSSYTQKGYTVSRIALTQADKKKTGCYDPNAKNKLPAPSYYAVAPLTADATGTSTVSTQVGCEYNSVSAIGPNWPVAMPAWCQPKGAYPGGYGLPVYTLNSANADTSWANTTFTSDKPFGHSANFSCTSLLAPASATKTAKDDFGAMAQAASDPNYVLDPGVADWANHFWNNDTKDSLGYVQWYEDAKKNALASPAKYANEMMNLNSNYVPPLSAGTVVGQLTTNAQWNNVKAAYANQTAPCSSSQQYATASTSASTSSTVFGVCVMPIASSLRFAQDTSPSPGQTTVYFPEFTAPSAGGNRYTTFAQSGQNQNGYASWATKAFTSWRTSISQEVANRDRVVTTDPLSKLATPSTYWAGSPYGTSKAFVDPKRFVPWSKTSAGAIADAAAAYAKKNAFCSVGTNAATPIFQPPHAGPNLTLYVNPIDLLALGDALNPQPVQIESLPFSCPTCAGASALKGYSATVNVTATSGYQKFHVLSATGQVLATSALVNGKQTAVVHVTGAPDAATFYLGFRNATTASQHVTITINAASATYTNGGATLSFTPTIGWAKYADAYPATISVPVASGTITPGH